METCPRRNILSKLLVDHEDHGHDVLEGSVVRVEVRPEVVLEVLADLEDHDALQRDGLASAALHAELVIVDLLNEVGIEGGGLGRRAPVLGGNAGEAVALDVEERDVASGGGGWLVRSRRRREVRGERVLGGAGVPELEDPGAVDLRHGWSRRGLGFAWVVVVVGNW